MALPDPSVARLRKLTPQQRLDNPYSDLLDRYRQHCEEVHGAKPEDYGMNVRAWHRRHHPRCTGIPALRMKEEKS